VTDTKALKPRLKEYLTHKGIQIVQKNGAARIHCPAPDHTDNEETAVVYAPGAKNNYNIWCAVCGTSWDIFEVAGLLCGLQSFPEKVNEVKKAFGIEIEKTNEKKYKAIPYEQAKKEFTTKRLLQICEFVGENVSKNRGDDPVLCGSAAQQLAWGDTITGAWPYLNEDGLFELLDVRFEGAGKKTVMSFYWTGKSVACSKYPILLYNRDKLYKNPTVPRMIHEGAKCAKIAEEKLPTFIHTTWNGGGAKAKQVFFAPLGTRAQIYIYPDDDQKKDNVGNMKSPPQQPGIKTGITVKQRIKKQLGIDAKLIQPYPKAREIKQDGADIVEALQVATPEELTEYIISSPEMEPSGPEKTVSPPLRNNPVDGGSVSGDEIPFRILGMADDKQAYYMSYAKILMNTNLTSLSKGFLKVLAPLSFWKNGFQHDFKMTTDSWDQATDWLIQSTVFTKFNIKRILGRGAWKNKDGSFCYWDGETLIGQADPEKIFEQKSRKDLGIKDKPASSDLCKEIFEVVKQMTFETDTDCIYLMAWSALSWVSGVLTYRPPILMTGESQTGKTAIFERIARPLSLSYELTGTESSPAGCRQENGNNSEGIIVEEADGKSIKDREKREAFLSLMRVSFCETAPDGYKGTPGHKAISFRMKSMFMFISIDPVVGDVADDKRLFIVNLIKKDNDWKSIKKNIDRLLTEKNCRAIRARTWSKLHEIIELAEKIGSILQEKIKLESRRSRAEGLLIAAYYYIWFGADEINLKDVNNIIDSMYTARPAEEVRNEADEIITRLLDESVPVDGYKNKMTLREIIQSIYTCRKLTGVDSDSEGKEILSVKDVQNLKNIAGRYGLTVFNGDLAIVKNHHEIKKIINMGTGYARHLTRHPGCTEKSYPVFISGKTRVCVIIAGVIDDIPF